MRDSGSFAYRKGVFGRAFRFACLLLAVAALGGRSLFATSVIPISDAELYRRADVIVHGVVLSSDMTVDDLGRPETLTFIGPLSVLKGQVSGNLVLHQAGGTLPDGRFFKLWGRPEYVPGREVVVFAIARAKGEYETAEMLLGKFEVRQDDAGERFAVPDLAIGIHPGVEIHRVPRKLHDALDAPADGPGDGDGPSVEDPQDGNLLPRRLPAFLASVRTGNFEAGVTGTPSGSLEPVGHETDGTGRLIPQWGTLGGALYRWNNNATAVWTLSGTTNNDDGGIGEANGATATWTNDPNSTINYTVGTGTANVISLNAVTSTLGCGWTSCLAGGGVIGCGGPTGLSGGNTWRGETYSTIVHGAVELRSYCTKNLYNSTLTQSVITHELGHTLGLGHSDTDVSPHDVCRGDESAAIMRSLVQSYTSLGTDDQDAIRWLYGDGGNSCGTGASAPAVTTTSASGVAQAAATLNGTVNPHGLSTTTYFQYGTTSSYGAATGQQAVGSGTSASQVTASLSSLVCGTLYHFRAVGTNADGTGNGSDMTLTTSACAAPSVPAITSPLAGGSYKVAGVTFSWGSVGGAGGYDLRLLDAQSGSTLFSGSLAGGGSTSTLIGLSNGSYVFAVRACGSGGFSDSTCGSFATRSFLVALTAPNGNSSVTFPASGAVLTGSTQTLAWTSVSKSDPNQPLYYEVLLRDVTAGTTELQITVPDPQLSTVYSMHSSSQYELKVRACQAGCGPYSTSVVFAVALPAVPTAAPAITGASVSGGNSLSVAWTGVSGADSYQVQVIKPTGGPGGGALTVAARQVSGTSVTLGVPSGFANVMVAGCNGDGCGPSSAPVGVTPSGPNPSAPVVGTPIAGTVVTGPGVTFSWSRVPGDTGSNTIYRLYVQDLSRQAAALDVYTTQNFWAAALKAEGSRYDVQVVANPGPSQVIGPSSGFNLRGVSAAAPTMVAPGHQSSVAQGNVLVSWSPVPNATLYEYFVAVQGQPSATAMGVTQGLFVQVPLRAVAGMPTAYSAIARACPAGHTCSISSDTGWGPWSNQPGGPGVTNFTVTP